MHTRRARLAVSAQAARMGCWTGAWSGVLVSRPTRCRLGWLSQTASVSDPRFHNYQLVNISCKAWCSFAVPSWSLFPLIGWYFQRGSRRVFGSFNIRRGWRRGAQLDREFALYASHRRLWALPGGVCSWTGRLLSTPLAANFGPGPEAAAEGGPTRRGVCIPSLVSCCRLCLTFA